MRQPTPPHLLISAVTCLVIALWCLSFLGCASSTVGKALNVGVVGAAGADYHSTRMAIGNGARESNPLAGQGAVQQAALKSLGVGAVIGLASLVEVKRPVLAHVLRAMAMTAWSVVAAHNYRLGMR